MKYLGKVFHIVTLHISDTYSSYEAAMFNLFHAEVKDIIQGQRSNVWVNVQLGAYV